MGVKVKICGIKTSEALLCAVDSGVDYVGFVFYPPSPRNISLDRAKFLSSKLPVDVCSVGLFVDSTDQELEDIFNIVRIDIIQLHGKETPKRVEEIKNRYFIPVMKAFPVSCSDDILAVRAYSKVVDWYVFDAKPSVSSDVPGGTGTCFDWSILQGHSFDKPWMLAGGLSVDNVKEAITMLSPNIVDVSSNVESSRGIKDINKIKAFIETVKGV